MGYTTAAGGFIGNGASITELERRFYSCYSPEQ